MQSPKRRTAARRTVRGPVRVCHCERPHCRDCALYRDPRFIEWFNATPAERKAIHARRDAERRVAAQAAQLNRAIHFTPTPYLFAGVPVDRWHLTYHLFPVAGSPWRDRLRKLVDRWEMFDGGKFVAVAVDHRTATLDEVRRALPADAVVKEFPNDRRLWERVSWDWLWESVLAGVKDADVVFRGHGKGTSHGLRNRSFEPGGQWSDALHSACLDFPELTADLIRTYPIVGPMFITHPGGVPGWHWPSDSRFHFAGSFYIVRAGDWQLKPWRFAAVDAFAVEWFPGQVYGSDQAGCLSRAQFGKIDTAVFDRQQQ